jgi:hypothetical protein
MKGPTSKTCMAEASAPTGAEWGARESNSTNYDPGKAIPFLDPPDSPAVKVWVPSSLLGHLQGALNCIQGLTASLQDSTSHRPMCPEGQ